MKKLKLQMQLSVDGFCGGPNGELDWITWSWDDELKEYVTGLTNSFDTILLGRKMTEGFITHWTNVIKDPDNPDYEAARIFVDTPKVVFTKTLEKSNWENTTLAKGNIVDEVNNLKNQNGKDLIVYGGAGFVSSLVKNNLIDEYYLFVNPSAIGKGISIFGSLEYKMNLELVRSNSFDCGIVLNQFEPKK